MTCPRPCILHSSPLHLQDCLVLHKLQALFQDHVLIWMGITTRKVCSDDSLSFPTSVALPALQITFVPPPFAQCFFNTCLDFSPAELCSTTHLPPQRANYEPLFQYLLTMKARVTYLCANLDGYDPRRVLKQCFWRCLPSR